VTGLSADEAQRLLVCVGLSSISFVSEFGSPPTAATAPPSGVVASQAPKAGTSVSPGSGVNLVLATPKP
jgi:beta-lactam-binding protein with PASTA domain